jgi:molybdate transport system permease protein
VTGSTVGRVGAAALSALLAGIVLAFLALPIIALFTEFPLGDVPDLLRDPFVQDALEVTARTNAIANALIIGLGTPTAYLIAMRRFPGRALVITLIELPLVLPPAVAGIALLSAFGVGGLFGPALQDAGIVLPFSQWAVVFAVTFVASPFYLRQAITSFESVDPALTAASRTLGAGPARTLLRVSLPLAAGGLLAGWVLAFARGVGEFGATIIFAGSFPGVTRTLPLAIYTERDRDFDVAVAMGALLVVVSVAILVAVNLLPAWTRFTSRSTTLFAPSGSS